MLNWIWILTASFFVNHNPEYHEPDWGFFGHRKINRYAVFTLPQSMLPLYKSNIDYITEHSVDPDKRRYATRYEAIRHYIDIDHWGDNPFEAVPKYYGAAVLKFSPIQLVKGSDTTLLNFEIEDDKAYFIDKGDTVVTSTLKSIDGFFFKDVQPRIYEMDYCDMNSSVLDVFFKVNYFHKRYDKIVIVDQFSDFGILPFHLIKTQKDLTTAFKNHDIDKVLRLSAEFGHYIGDAHVPLHTTENYNGQMTNQVGIHAFWESRIPELFAEKDYDFFAGKATYISDPVEYYWQIVLKSHSYLDEVLGIEQRLRKEFPTDLQFCYDERLNNNIRIECPEFAKAYQDAMNGMVEERMIAAIKAIGDAWYTAWVDAGQPKLLNVRIESNKGEEYKVDPNIKVRAHDNR